MVNDRWGALLLPLAMSIGFSLTVGCGDDHAAKPQSQRGPAPSAVASTVEYQPLPLPRADGVEPLPAGTTFDFPRRKLAGHESPVAAIRYSIDGKYAITADEEGKIICWDPVTGEAVHEGTVDSASPISAVDIHTSGKLAIIVRKDHTFELLDLVTGELRDIPATDGHEVWAGCFLSDPSLMVLRAFQVSSKDHGGASCKTVLVINVETGEVVASERTVGQARNLTTDDDPWQIVASQLDGKYVEFVGGRTFHGQLALLPRQEHRGLRVQSWGNLSGHWGRDHDLRVLGVAFPLNHQQLYLVATNTGLIGRIPRYSGAPDFSLQVALTGNHRRIRWLPGSDYIVVYDGDTALRHYDAKHGKSATAHSAQRSDIACIALAPSCLQAITAYQNGEVHLIELPPPIISGSMMAGSIKDQIRDAWQKSDFEQLDELAQQCRESTAKTDTGFPMIRLFYEQLSDPAERSPQQWEAHLQRHRDWVEQRPESATARISLAEALIAYGWEARGSGTIDTVTAEGYELFKERVMEAGVLLEEAGELDNQHAELYEVQLRAARGIGMPKHVMYLSFKAGRSIDPDHLPLYSQMAINLLPRWFGEFGELAEFLESQREVLDEEQYLRMYAWTFGQIKCFLGEEHLAAFGFDYDAVAKGATLLKAEHPTNMWFANIEAWALARIGDREAALQSLNQISGNLNDRFFYSTLMYRRVQSWADARSDSAQQQWVQLADTHAVYSVAYSPDGEIIATGGYDPLRQIKLWDAQTGEALASLPAADTVHAVEFHPSQVKLVVAGGSDGAGFVNVWNLDDVAAEPNNLDAPPGVLTTAAFSPDGTRLAVGGDGQEVWIWQAKSAKAGVAKIAIGEEIRALQFLPDDDRLMVATPTQLVLVDYESEKIVQRMGLSPTFETQAAVPVGNSLFAGGRDKRIVELAIGETTTVRAINVPEIRDVPAKPDADNYIMAIAASPDGRLLVASHSFLAHNFPDPKIHPLLVFDRETGGVVGKLSGHSLFVDAVAFSPDGTQIASVSRDATLRVWNVPEVSESDSKEVAE